MARFMLFLFVAASTIFTSRAEQFQKVSLIFGQSNLRDLKPFARSYFITFHFFCVLELVLSGFAETSRTKTDRKVELHSYQSLLIKSLTTQIFFVIKFLLQSQHFNNFCFNSSNFSFESNH